jgi:CRP/FNR family transcriptional regulator, cyclic AMP receptor protein
MGRVQVEKTAGQVKKVLAEMGPGSYFGEMAALIDAPRTASALALEDCDIAVVEGHTFRSLLHESGEISLFMMKEFSNRIKHTNVVLDELTQSWIKLVVILYFLKNWPLQDKQDPVGDLAKYTGKDPGEIQEVFAELATEGILTVLGNRVTGFTREKAWALLDRQLFV